MAHEPLTIKELQSIIYNQRMNLRRYHWDMETKNAEICQANIDKYEQQLKTLQDEKAKA
jgi:hypothetical protein